MDAARAKRYLFTKMLVIFIWRSYNIHMDTAQKKKRMGVHGLELGYSTRVVEEGSGFTVYYYSLWNMRFIEVSGCLFRISVFSINVRLGDVVIFSIQVSFFRTLLKFQYAVIINSSCKLACFLCLCVCVFFFSPHFLQYAFMWMKPCAFSVLCVLMHRNLAPRPGLSPPWPMPRRG